MRPDSVEGHDRLHLAGVVLPEGEHRDLWVADGVIRTEPVSEAHCHGGVDHARPC